jgi:hypothetical protein
VDSIIDGREGDQCDVQGVRQSRRLDTEGLEKGSTAGREYPHGAGDSDHVDIRPALNHHWMELLWLIATLLLLRIYTHIVTTLEVDGTVMTLIRK